MSNTRCRGRRKAAVDYVKYYPARDGHVIEVEVFYSHFQPDELNAGSQLGYLPCARCGQWASVTAANDIERGGDETPYMPHDPERWRQLNRIAG